MSRSALIASAWLASACAVSGENAPQSTVPEPIDPIAAIDRDAELAQLRRENDRLRRDLRKTRAMARATPASGATPRPAAKPSSPFPRHLPVVKVGPDSPEAEQAPATGRVSGAVSLGEVPHSGVDEAPPDGLHPDREHLPALAPAGDDSTASYHLVGSKLVRASKRERPAPAPAPVPNRKLEVKSSKKSAKSKSGKRSRRGGDPVLSAYKDAMTLYKAGEMVAAERAFDQIVSAHASHEYADNALYWQGEAAYDQKHYDAALSAFTGVIERYGGGNKAPDALLKIGLCYGKLGDMANSRDVLTQLVSAYPSARATKIAQSRLAELPEG
jgi:tol-pal system protein YbgF